jgi:hypothetical protein
VAWPTTSSAFTPFPAITEVILPSATIVFATQFLLQLKQLPLRQRKRQSTRSSEKGQNRRASCCPHGEMASFDVTVVNPLYPSYVSRASRVAGAEAEACHCEKMSKHFDNCEEAGLDFFVLLSI